MGSSPAVGRQRVRWSDRRDPSTARVCSGLERELVADSATLQTVFHDKRRAVDLKDKYRNLSKQ